MKFTSVLKSILLENSRFELLYDNLTKPTKNKEGRTQKPKLTEKEFFDLVSADPTTRPENIDFSNKEQLKDVKAGKYVNWLIKSYLGLPSTVEVSPDNPEFKRELTTKKELFFEDLYKITDDLKKFERFKNRLPQESRDINKMTPRDLYNAVKDFDLTLATTTKAERKSADVHKGAKIVFEGNKWRVVEISDKTALGKEAACFYGGNQKETRWCTSAPGLQWFERYIKDGPLYVIYDPRDTKVSPQTGLPVERYQFHFQSDQFMDKDDARVDLVKLLSKGGSMEELKEMFKPYFAKGLTSGDGDSLIVTNFSSGAVGKFIGIYGLTEMFDNLPSTLKELRISNDIKNGVVIDVPESISKFRDLWQLQLDGCIDKIPDSICQLKSLNFISLRNNPQLQTIPECIADLPCLQFFNAEGSKQLRIPEKIKQTGDAMDDDELMYNFSNNEC